MCTISVYSNIPYSPRMPNWIQIRQTWPHLLISTLKVERNSSETISAIIQFVKYSQSLTLIKAKLNMNINYISINVVEWSILILINHIKKEGSCKPVSSNTDLLYFFFLVFLSLSSNLCLLPDSWCH